MHTYTHTHTHTHTHTPMKTQVMSKTAIHHLLFGGPFFLPPFPPRLRFLCHFPPVRVSSRSVVSVASGRDGGRDASREVGAPPDLCTGMPSPTWLASGLSTEPSVSTVGRTVPLLLRPLPPRTVGGGSVGEEGAASASSGRLRV